MTDNILWDDLDEIDGGFSLSELQGKLQLVKQKVQTAATTFSQKTQQASAALSTTAQNVSNIGAAVTSFNGSPNGSPRLSRPVSPVLSDRNTVVQSCVNQCDAFSRELATVEQRGLVSSTGLKYNDVTASIETLLGVADSFLNNDQDINILRKRCTDQSGELRRMLDTFKPPVSNVPVQPRLDKVNTALTSASSWIGKVGSIFGGDDSGCRCCEGYSSIGFVVLIVLVLLVIYYVFVRTAECLVTNSPQLLSSEIEQREPVTFSNTLNLPYGMF